MSPRQPESIPHAFPCRLVERAEEGTVGKVAVVLGTAGGALTGTGTWPVTLVAEALAQAILLVVRPERQDNLRLIGLDGVRVIQPVSPGDRLEVDVTETGDFGALRRYHCRALRAGGLVAVADVTVRS